jgi:hypothetical protein
MLPALAALPARANVQLFESTAPSGTIFADAVIRQGRPQAGTGNWELAVGNGTLSSFTAGERSFTSGETYNFSLAWVNGGFTLTSEDKSHGYASAAYSGYAATDRPGQLFVQGATKTKETLDLTVLTVNGMSVSSGYDNKLSLGAGKLADWQLLWASPVNSITGTIKLTWGDAAPETPAISFLVAVKNNPLPAVPAPSGTALVAIGLIVTGLGIRRPNSAAI